MKRIYLAALALLAIATPAFAQQYQVPHVSGVWTEPRATAPFASTKRGIWVNSSDGLPYFRKSDGSDASMTGGGGGGVTWPLQNGSSQWTAMGGIAAGATPAYFFDTTNAFNSSKYVYRFATGGVDMVKFFAYSNGAEIDLFDATAGTQLAGIKAQGAANALSIVNGSGTAMWTFNATTQTFPANGIFATTAQAATNTTSTTITTNVADGASSIGLLVNGSTALANAAAELLELQNNGTKRYRFLAAASTIDSNTTDFTIQRSANDGMAIFSNAIRLYVNGGVSGGVGVQLDQTDFRPLTANLMTSGTSGQYWKGEYSAWYGLDQGAQLTAAATITPTRGQHHVTGATTINIISNANLPASMNARFCAIADSTVNWGTSGSAGGIAVAPAATATNHAQCFVYDAATTFWYGEI